MSRFCTIFIFLCGLLTATNAQSFAVADSLFAVADYELAAVEYERCVYLSESRETTHLALERKAECFKRMGNYGRAADVMERYAASYAELQQIALCRYLDGYFRDAAFAVDRCEMLHDTLGEDMLLLKLLALNEQALYDSARAVGRQLAARHAKATGEDISPLLDSIYGKKPCLKSETLGWYLSLVPGLGHAYAGEYGLGAAAFAMNAACLAFGVWQVFEGCYITAYMGGAGLLSVTYPGAMRSATHYIKKANYERTAAFNAGCKAAVMDALKGR